MEERHLRIYRQFIEGRQNRIIGDSIYTELHHIWPRSLGGTNEPDNLIRLTAREHFIAHLILWKSLGGKMTYAFWRMAHSKQNGESYWLSSRQYKSLKEDLAKEVSVTVKKHLTGKKRIHKGFEKSFLIPKQELSFYLDMGYELGFSSPELSKYKYSEKREVSKETRRKISEANKGREVSIETRRKISEAHTGHVVSDETKEKIRRGHKGLSSHRKDLSYEQEYGKEKSDEIKEKLSEGHPNFSGSNNPYYGKKHSLEIRKKISDRIHANSTPEERSKIACTTKNRIWVKNEEINENKMIPQSEINYYIENGWQRGRLSFKRTKESA
jgi:hypothetical protein